MTGTTPAVIRRIADLVRARQTPAQTATVVDVLRTIADLTSRAVMTWFRDNRELLHRTAGGTLPAPVMAISGLGSREVPWTNYLGHMLDPDQAHGLGDSLARTVVDLATGEPTLGAVQVWRERELGSTRCPICSKVHGWRIDLVVMSADAAVAIEQKTTSGPSNWNCCGQTHSQLDAYGSLFPTWVRSHHDAALGSTEPPRHGMRFLYLTPSGTRPRTQHSEWQPVSHSDLAASFASALPEITDPVARFNLSALLLDLNSGALGSWAELLTRTRSATTHDATPTFLQVLALRQDLDGAPALLALLSAHTPELAERWRLP